MPTLSFGPILPSSSESLAYRAGMTADVASALCSRRERGTAITACAVHASAQIHLECSQGEALWALTLAKEVKRPDWSPRTTATNS